MNQDDIDCYRINYDKKKWLNHAIDGWVELPTGILDAVMCLCNEVERLNKWRHNAKSDKRRNQK